ncbi:MAG: GyrI-like domain-containing protein [Clostridium sp.]|nr:GyrI-like domain-containing protein [Clostridium sp.]
MDYEIVQLNEKKVAGITIRTNNNDKNMKQLIGELWQRFLTKGIYEDILNKKNNSLLGLYSDYESDANGYYNATVCCEITEYENLPKGVIKKIIPAGKYAKFIVRGNMQTAVNEFWTKLWPMNLNRKYTSDFEEYKDVSDINNCEIHIYIALN